MLDRIFKKYTHFYKAIIDVLTKILKLITEQVDEIANSNNITHRHNVPYSHRNIDAWYLIRPSDKRSPGKDPRLQYAFENQVLGVSCISHRLTQLAAFFIDQRTEWSTVCSCTLHFYDFHRLNMYSTAHLVFAQINGRTKPVICRHCIRDDNN